MNTVEMCTKELAKAIVESPEYREYESCKEKVHEDPELFSRLLDFRKKGYILHNSKEGKELYDEVERFEKEYGDFQRMPLVTEYMAAELSVCQMMQKINRELLDSIDLELEFRDLD